MPCRGAAIKQVLPMNVLQWIGDGDENFVPSWWSTNCVGGDVHRERGAVAAMKHEKMRKGVGDRVTRLCCSPRSPADQVLNRSLEAC